MTKREKITAFVEMKFEGMTDKMGFPYAAHSFRVANDASTFGRTDAEKDSLWAVGALHDVFEDTDALGVDLIGLGLTDAELEAVYNVTNKFNNGEKLLSYEAFIERTIRGGFLSTAVKMADVMDNLTRPKHDGFKWAEKLRALSNLAAIMKAELS